MNEAHIFCITFSLHEESTFLTYVAFCVAPGDRFDCITLEEDVTLKTFNRVFSVCIWKNTFIFQQKHLYIYRVIRKYIGYYSIHFKEIRYSTN
jgi:hypothetical protein